VGLDHASLTSLAALGEATRRRMFELFRHERRLTHSIEEFGHEPERTAPTLMRLRNGPFHPMAAKAPELICAVKQAFWPATPGKRKDHSGTRPAAPLMLCRMRGDGTTGDRPERGGACER
jgi:hypothetical protein